MGEIVKEKIGDGIELLIEGLPQSAITPAIQAKTAMSLIQHGIPIASSFGAGVIGGIRTATLQIGSEFYKLKFSIIALRAITALEIYSEAIQWIEFKKSRGAVDWQLAEDTINYLREDLRNKQEKWLEE